MKKYFIAFCLAGAIAFAPIRSASARYYHTGDALVAAAVGGAVVGLVGAVVQNVLAPTVVVSRPRYIAPMPIVVHRPVAFREPHYRPMPIGHSRHHHRHH